MPNIVRINVDGSMNDIKIPITTLKTIIKQLDKISISKGTTDLKQLYRCIKSIQIQKFKDYEVIISTQNKYDDLKNDEMEPAHPMGWKDDVPEDKVSTLMAELENADESECESCAV